MLSDFSHTSITVGSFAIAGQGAIEDRLAGLDGAVEPGAHAVGGCADRYRYEGPRGSPKSRLLSCGSLLASLWLSTAVLPAAQRALRGNF